MRVSWKGHKVEVHPAPKQAGSWVLEQCSCGARALIAAGENHGRCLDLRCGQRVYRGTTGVVSVETGNDPVAGHIAALGGC